MNLNQLQNNGINNALQYFSEKMQTPIDALNPDQITYLQTYLETIKNRKIQQLQQRNNFPLNRATDLYDPMQRGVPVDWRTFSNSQQATNIPNQQSVVPGSRGSACTRIGKKSHNDAVGNTNSYFNPYEYGARQNSLSPTYQERVTGPYINDLALLNQMGLHEATCQQNPAGIRNIGIESLLQQREMTHIPGQREITQKEMDRFQLLPFDPQDTRHIVWKDNMPRGGYPTRSDRLEL